MVEAPLIQNNKKSIWETSVFINIINIFFFHLKFEITLSINKLLGQGLIPRIAAINVYEYLLSLNYTLLVCFINLEK